MGRTFILTLLTTFAAAAPSVGRGPEEARFTTDDGVQIVGEFIPAGRGPAPVVILLHMYRSDRSAWQPLVDDLHAADVAVLAIDLRGHGDSVKPASMSLRQRVIGRDETLFANMYRDVLAAYEWLTWRSDVDLSRIGLVGASVGCSVAIDYAARDRSLDVVVCLTPGEDYLGLDSRKHIAEFGKHGQRPILLSATEDERKATDALAAIYKSATVRIVGGGRVHGTRMFGRVADVERQTVEFLAAHLNQGVGTSVVAAVDGEEYFAVGSKMDIELDRSRRRLFSSAEEAQARGLRRATGLEATQIVDPGAHD